MESIDTFLAELEAHILTLRQTMTESSKILEEIAGRIESCFQSGNKMLICGNGGSAADAQHVAGEFINRFHFDRAPLPALALTTDSSVITCIGNDASFEFIFSRQVEALAQKGDIVVGISTSGGSVNVLHALKSAHDKGAYTIGFTGENGHAILGQQCDLCLVVPSSDTARIQECHEFAWHLICGWVEQALFPQGNGKQQGNHG